MDYEAPFAEDAQEQAQEASGQLRQRPQPSVTLLKTGGHSEVHEDESSADEQSRLMGPDAGRPQRQAYTRAGESYQRAINQPWTGAHGSGKQSWYKKPSIFWLLPAFFPFCVAFGGIIVPKTYLIIDLICQEYLSDRAATDPNFDFLPVILGQENPQCRDPKITAKVSLFNLYMNLVTGILSAIVTPHIGALSDRIGRKKVLVVASLGGFVTEVVTIIVARNAGRVSYYWLLLSAVADGLCGSFTAAMAVAHAYAADCTPPERRNVAFGMFHGTLFLGIALGPLLSAFLMSKTGSIITPFYVALGCHVWYISFTTFFTPESLSKERRILAQEKHQVKRLETSEDTWWTTLKKYNLFEPLWVLRPSGPGSSAKLRRNVVVLAAIDTMMFGVAMGTMNILIIAAQNRFGWNEVDSSLFMSATNICRITGLFVLLPLLTRVFRGPVTGRSSGHRGSDKLDVNIIRGAILFDLLGYIGYSFAPTGAVFALSGMVASIAGIGSPTLQSSLTKHFPADRTGQILGASGLLHALARVVAPVIFNLIFYATVAVYPGTVFICLGSIFILAFIASWFLKPYIYFDEANTEDISANVDEDEVMR